MNRLLLTAGKNFDNCLLIFVLEAGTMRRGANRCVVDWCNFM